MIGIVVSEWYWEEITGKMLELAVKTAEKHNIPYKILKVPGSFEIPFAVKTLLQDENIKGVVTLGAVIKGATEHDKVIAYTVAKSITELSLHYNKPVVLGINGPGMSKQQAIERIPRAGDVTEACLRMMRMNDEL